MNGLTVFMGGPNNYGHFFFQLVNFILKIVKLTKLSRHLPLVEELLFYNKINILAKPCAERLKFISKSRCQMTNGPSFQLFK